MPQVELNFFILNTTPHYTLYFLHIWIFTYTNNWKFWTTFMQNTLYLPVVIVEIFELLNKKWQLHLSTYFSTPSKGNLLYYETLEYCKQRIILFNWQPTLTHLQTGKKILNLPIKKLHILFILIETNTLSTDLSRFFLFSTDSLITISQSWMAKSVSLKMAEKCVDRCKCHFAR